MELPRLTEEDLARIANVLPTLDFGDEERQRVLLASETCDTQAAPGSGKTTLVAAKLILLAEKWRSPDRGICVLSHTNVARDEIVSRLSKTEAGTALLSYPHYIGTIHGFVNHHAALPMLRSDGLRVRVIDDAVFARQALRLARRKPNLRGWLSRNQYQGERAIRTLRFSGAELELSWDEGKVPGQQSPSGREAREVKDELRDAGVFRHADMFAFAERLLLRAPQFPERISHRFPLVLIDEMQDTSWEQETLLERFFGDEAAVVQRFGDRNQRILGDAKNSDRLTFPREGFLSVRTSKRFTSSVACVVRSMQEQGGSVQTTRGAGHPPALILYETPSAARVVEQFGKLVLERFTDEELAEGTIRAIGARKESGSKQAMGRCILDYFPSFSNNRQASTTASLRSLLGAEGNRAHPAAFADRALLAKQVLLRILREAKAPVVAETRDPRWVLWTVEKELPAKGQVLRRLCHWLCTRGREAAATDSWDATVRHLFVTLQPLLPAGVDLQKFRELRAIRGDGEEPEPDDSHVAQNMLLVQDGERSITIDVGTIASAKGETHLATLVLECVDKSGKAFDLGGVLGRVAEGQTTVEMSTKEGKRAVLRNMYVAVSRPRDFLCLAMNRERASDDDVASLRSKGWDIVEV